MIRGSLGIFTLQVSERGSVDKIEVHPTVAVVVNPADPRTIYLEHIVLLRPPRDDHASESGAGGGVLEARGRDCPSRGKKNRRGEQGVTHVLLRAQALYDLRLFRGETGLAESRVHARQLQTKRHVRGELRQGRFEQFPRLFELFESNKAAGLSKLGGQTRSPGSVVVEGLPIPAGFLQGIGETQLGLALARA